MKIQRIYIGTAKSAVATYEIYADGLRIGFVKIDKGEGKEIWHAVQWRHKHIGLFVDRSTAVKAVIEFYEAFRAKCTARQARTFESKAIKFHQR